MNLTTPSAETKQLEGVERRLKIRHADALMRLEFEPLITPVENLIPEGLTLLCGASKIGKSWLVLSLCCAVASGRPFLGRETTEGDVLYLALEDSERRLQARLNALGESPTENLVLACASDSLENGLLDQLRDWCKHVTAPRMIVIDTFQKIRGATPGRANAYALDYEAIGKLKDFADRQRVALILVHHLNKQKDASDPYDRISGSTGLMGAADTIIMIDRERGSNDARLTFTGRDVWGDDLNLRMCDGRWTVIGHDTIEREAYENNPIVQTVRKALAEGFGGEAKIASEDLRDTIQRVCGFCPYGTKDKASKAVSAVAPNLLRYDGISTERVRLGTKNGLRFTKDVQKNRV